MEVSLQELSLCAREVLARIPVEQGERSCIIALRGELGAGKTTFMQALARALDVKGLVQSPTFVLMKSYEIAFKRFTKLVHIDAYRLEKAEDFTALKPERFLDDPEALVCIEWPERVEGILPKPDLTVSFAATEDPNAREVSIE